MGKRDKRLISVAVVVACALIAWLVLFGLSGTARAAGLDVDGVQRWQATLRE